MKGVEKRREQGEGDVRVSSSYPVSHGIRVKVRYTEVKKEKA